MTCSESSGVYSSTLRWYFAWSEPPSWPSGAVMTGKSVDVWAQNLIERSQKVRGFTGRLYLVSYCLPQDCHEIPNPRCVQKSIDSAFDRCRSVDGAVVACARRSRPRRRGRGGRGPSFDVPPYTHRVSDSPLRRPRASKSIVIVNIQRKSLRRR